MSLRVTGKLRVDLRSPDDDEQYRAIGSLQPAPCGAEVELIVDRPPLWGTVARLQDWATHCRFVIVATDPDIVPAWIRGLAGAPEASRP